MIQPTIRLFTFDHGGRLEVEKQLDRSRGTPREITLKNKQSELLKKDSPDGRACGLF